MKPPFGRYRPGDMPSSSEENEKAEEIFRLSQGSGGASGVEGKSSFQGPKDWFWAMLLGTTYPGGGAPNYYTFVRLWEDGTFIQDTPPVLSFAQDLERFVGPLKVAGVVSTFPAYEVNDVTTALCSTRSSILTPAAAITNASNTTPIQITTGAANGLVNGEEVIIWGVEGNDAANGQWFLTRIDATNFTLDQSVGNGAYTSGGDWATFDGSIVLMWPGEGGEYFCFEAPPQPIAEVAACTLYQGSQVIPANTETNVEFFVDAQAGTALQIANTGNSNAGITIIEDGFYQINANVAVHIDTGTWTTSDYLYLVVYQGEPINQLPLFTDVRRMLQNVTLPYTGNNNTLPSQDILEAYVNGIRYFYGANQDRIFFSIFCTKSLDLSKSIGIAGPAFKASVAAIGTLVAFTTTTTTSTTTTSTTTTSTTTTTGTTSTTTTSFTGTTVTTTTGTTTTGTTTTTTTTSTTTTTTVCSLSTTPKGTNSVAGGNDTVTITSVSVSTGDVLVVGGAAVMDFDGFTATCTWNGISMTRDLSLSQTVTPGWLGLNCFHLKITSGGTGNIVLTRGGGVSADFLGMVVFARSFTGLPNGTLDAAAHNTGTTSSSPDSGGSSTSSACDAWTGTLAQWKSSADPTVGTWSNSFTNGQTQAQATSDGGHLSINEGYRLVSSTGTIDAAKTGTTQDGFVINAVAIK